MRMDMWQVQTTFGYHKYYSNRKINNSFESKARFLDPVIVLIRYVLLFNEKNDKSHQYNVIFYSRK